MRRRLAIGFLLTVVTLVVGAIGFARSQLAADLLCDAVVDAGRSRLGATVEVGWCELDPFSMAVVLHDLHAAAPDQGLDVKARRVEVRLREVQGLSRAPDLQSLDVDGLVLTRTPPPAAEDPAPAPSATPAADAAPCEAPRLPFELSEATLHDAALSLDYGAAGKVEARGLTLSARPAEEGRRVELEAEAVEVARGGRTEQVQDLSARVHLDLEAQRADLESFSAASGDLHVGLRGRVQGLCEPDADVTVVASGAFARLLALAGLPDERGPVEGRLALSAHLRGRLGAPDVTGSLEVVGGRIGSHRLGDVHFEGGLLGHRLQIARLSTSALGEPALVTGEIVLGPHLPATLHVESDGASLERLVDALGHPGPWVDGRIVASGDLSGTLSPLALDGEAKAEIRSFEVLDRDVTRGPATEDETYLTLPPTRIEGAVSVRAGLIRVPHARLHTGSSRVSLSASFPLHKAGPMEVAADLGSVDLADLDRIAGLPFQGVLTGTASVSGAYDDPHIEGRVDARGLVVDGLEAGVGQARIVYDRYHIRLHDAYGQRGRTPYTIEKFDLVLKPKPVDFDIRVSADGGRIEDIVEALDGYTAYASYFRGVTGRGRGSVHLTGPKQRLTAILDVTASDGSLRGQPYRRLRVKGRLFERRRWEFDEAVLSLDEGSRLTVRGWAEKDGPLALSVSARDVPVSALAPLTGSDLGGRLSGDLVVQGTWDVPEANGGAALTGGTWQGLALRPVRLQVSLHGRRLGLSGRLAGEALTGTGWVELQSPYPFEADLNLDEDDLGQWLPPGSGPAEALAGWQGAATGEVHLAGLLRHPQSLHGTARLDRLAARHDDLILGARGPVEARIVDGGVVVERLVVGAEGSELSVTGVRALDGQLDLALRGHLDLGLLSTLVPSVTRASGGATLEATASGTLTAPVLVGSAELEGGTVGVTGLPFALEDLSGRMSFSQSRLIVDDLQGAAGGGRVALSGEVGLDRFVPGRVHLAARLDAIHTRVPEGLRSVVSGGLFLDGPLDGLVLTGDLDVDRARWAKDLEVDTLIPTFKKRIAAAPAPDRAPLLRFDVGLHAPGTIRVENRNLTATLRADLRLTGSDVHPGLVGTVSSVEGRALFRGNEWTVTQALVDFKERDRILPSFDVHAESDVRDYRVYVHAFGTPDRLRLDLSSDPDLAETDLVTLVTLGITSRDAEAGFGGGDAAWAAADALFAISGLDRHVRSFIPRNPILRDASLRLTSGYSRGTGQVEPRLAFESRVLVDELRLRYSAPLGIRGQRTQAEYRITDTVSVQAEWDTENQVTSLGNVGLDLKLRWEGE